MVQPFGSKAEAKGDLVPSSVSLVLADGGPLGIKIAVSCLVNSLRGESSSFSPRMSVHVSFGVDAKEIDRVGDFGSDDLLSEDKWEVALRSLVPSCLAKLVERGLNIPNGYGSDIQEALVAARRSSLLVVVRAFARHMIKALPAGDACQVWMEEEAKLIFDS